VIRMLATAAVLVVAVASTTQAQTAFSERYDAASGFHPDQPHWVMSGSGTGALVDGKLIISTTSDGQDRVYWQTIPAAPSPVAGPLIVEARLKFVSGSSSHAERAPVRFHITTAPDTGVQFFVDRDRIFLTQAPFGSGSLVAAFADTDDGFHTYRIEVSGSAVNVSFDGAPALSGETYVDPDHGSVGRVLWGEGSGLAHGVSEWEFFRHNAGCDMPCQDEAAEVQQLIQDLQDQILALTQQYQQLAARNGTLESENDALLQQIASLQDELIACLQQPAGPVQALAHTLLGEPPTAAVIVVLAAETRAEIDQAIAAFGTDHRRIRVAERHYAAGLAAQAAGRRVQARREFRAAFQTAHMLLEGRRHTH